MRFLAPSMTPFLFCAMLALSGCTTAGLNLGLTSETHEKESSDNPVEQIVPVWQEAEGQGINGHQSSRGFGGQIYFITQQRGLPSEVDGNVRIYVFDDQGAKDEVAKPIHQFDFNPEAWKTHLTISKLGPAYSVFIPYTRPGFHLAQCSLRIRYTPKQGRTVFSQMVALTLPGTKKEQDAAPKTESDGATAVLPELSKRKQPALKRVTQVSATGDVQEQQRVRPAGYETPATSARSSGRVKLSDYDAPAGDVQQAFLGDEMIESGADEAEEDWTEEPAPRSRGSRGTPISEDDEADVAMPDDDESQRTVRTYTIRLD